jgi:hypothetical protein
MNDNNSVQTTRSSTGAMSCNGAGKRYAKLQSLGQCAQCPMTAPCNNPCANRMVPVKPGTRPMSRPMPRPLRENYQTFVGIGADAQGNLGFIDLQQDNPRAYLEECGAWMDISPNCAL